MVVKKNTYIYKIVEMQLEENIFILFFKLPTVKDLLSCLTCMERRSHLQREVLKLDS